MNKEILRLAVPNILSNLSVPLLSSVDTALMGRQESVSYIGAVALGALIFNFVYWSFGFLRMGTTGLTAQAHGEDNRQKVILILGRAMLFALVSGLILLVLQYPIKAASLSILDGSGSVETLAGTYFSVRIWAAPATLSLYVLMGWFFGMQNAWYPLWLTIFINGINIIANIFLVYYLGWDVEGVALGTVIAQYSGLAFGLGLLYYKYKAYFSFFQQKALFEIEALKSFFSLNRDIFIRTFVLVFSFAFFENQSAALGDTTLAINSILLQFVAWLSYGIDGFAFASESLVGKYKGANNPEKLRLVMLRSFQWGFGLAVSYSLVFYLFDETLLSLFTNNADLIQAALPFVVWVIIFPLISVGGYIWDGIYIGLTASKAMRTTMLLSFLIFMLTYFIVDFFLISIENHVLWAVFSLFILSRGIVQTYWYFKFLRPNNTTS